MLEVLFGSQARYGADYEVVRPETKRRAALIAVVAARIEAREIDAVANHYDPPAVDFQEPTLRKDHVADCLRFADYTIARRFVGKARRQTDAVHALDDGAYVGVAGRGYRVGPGVQEARIDAVGAEPCRETFAVFLASSFIADVPGPVRCRLVVADHYGDAERRRIFKKTSRTEGVQVRGEPGSVESLHERQASQFLTANFKAVADECHANHKLCAPRRSLNSFWNSVRRPTDSSYRSRISEAGPIARISPWSSHMARSQSKRRFSEPCDTMIMVAPEARNFCKVSVHRSRNARSPALSASSSNNNSNLTCATTPNP